MCSGGHMFFSKKQTVGEFLFDYLYKQGVETAFGIPGDFVLPTYKWLDKSKMDVVVMTHEPSVGFAADCYARSKGLGVAIVTYCVGGLNMLNSIACAYAEKSPVIVISGGPSPKERHKDSMLHHKVRSFESQKRVFDEVTCASTILLDPENAAEEIMRVVEEVKRQSRPGYIEVPYDLVDEIIPTPSAHKKYKPLPSDPKILDACVNEISERINKAERPVIVAGIELQRHKLTDLASQFAKEHQIPITATLLAKSVVRETNPLYMGVYSGALSCPECRDYVDSSDCVILLGAFISDVLLGFQTAKLDPDKTISLNMDKIQVGMHYYDDIHFEDVLASLVKADIRTRDIPQLKKVEFPQPLSDTAFDDEMDAKSLFDILSTNIPEEGTIICDTGDALVGAIDLRVDTRSHFFSDAYYLSMGFAAPAVVGASFALPDSKIYGIIGDGAFQMTGMELSTMAKHRLSPVIIVINNDGYGTQRHILDGEFNNIHMWDYTKMCELLHYGQARKVKTKGEFDLALKEARDYNELFFIEVIIPKNDSSPSLRRMGEAIGKLRNPNKA